MKRKNKYTPGPWSYDGKIGDRYFISNDVELPIFNIACKRQEALQNVRLIAAAPDLLEACKLAFERLRPMGIKEDFPGHVAISALGKAIAKAEGERQ